MDWGAIAAKHDGYEQDPGFIVFVADQAGKNYLCNATRDAAVWVFGPIGDPINFDATKQQS